MNWDTLNPEQQAAVRHTEGPLLVFAGAGSGKTRVITYRIANLIMAHGVAPPRILAVTFTNKAAEEMKSRLDDLLAGAARGLWVGTFHAICARILRESGQAIDIQPNFLVYDESDQVDTVRQVLHALNMDEKQFTPRAFLYAISRAKEKLISPEEFERNAYDFFDRLTAQVYPRYQAALKAANALDFDDLLLAAIRLFQEQPAVLERYQDRFQYILVDEYQDVNYAQYVLVKQLSGKHRNLCVVGDDDQCVAHGTPVLTLQGEQPIECLDKADMVFGASGWNKVAAGKVEAANGRHYEGTMIRLLTESGQELSVTPNHIMFTRLEPNNEHHYVYLMYRKGKGYRIGHTQGARIRKMCDDRVSGLQLRINQQAADKIWILKVCQNLSEALFCEQYFASRYGIPTTVFHAQGRRMTIRKNPIDCLHRAIDTETRALQLMNDRLLFEEYPHYMPSAVIRGDSARHILRLTIFGDPHPHEIHPWHEHQIQLITSDQALRERIEGRYKTQDGQEKTWRTETSRKGYDETFAFARKITAIEDIELFLRARLTQEAYYQLMPASQIHPGMKVPVYRDGMITEAAVSDVEWLPYKGFVHDLSVLNLRNYIANGIVVHNSIYSFRGAEVELILRFQKDYPDATVIKLERNYRSTQPILDAAYRVVSQNRFRAQKKLWTDREEGMPLTLTRAQDEMEEARLVADYIQRMVMRRERRYSDFAVLYRTNAQSRAFEDFFTHARIPHRIVGALRFYDRKEIKDLLAYLRLIVNPDDAVSLRRVINVPPRGIGSQTVLQIQQYALLHNIGIGEVIRSEEFTRQLTARAKKSIQAFSDLIADLQQFSETHPVSKLTKRVIDQSGYLDWLRAEGSTESRDRAENIQEFLNVALQFEETSEDKSLLSFLQQSALVSDMDTLGMGGDQVLLMTLHTSKGLEFPVVFLVGLEEGVLPHARSNTPDQIEEERRLCYVGMTRAQNELHLLFAQARRSYSGYRWSQPSRFLKAIPQESTVPLHQVMFGGYDPASRASRPDSFPAPQQAMPETDAATGQPLETEFLPGQRVRHSKFGMGVVIRTEPAVQGDAYVTVMFPGAAGMKTLLASAANLEVLA